jgi:hypothetical protein
MGGLQELCPARAAAASVNPRNPRMPAMKLSNFGGRNFGTTSMRRN